MVPTSSENDFIVAAVIKPDQYSGYHNIVDNSAVDPMLWVDSRSPQSYEANRGGSFPTTNTVNGGWDVIVFSSASGTIRMNWPAPTSYSCPSFLYTAASSISFFHRSSSLRFRGLVAELRVYNGASAFGGNYNALISELYNKWIAPSPPSPPPPQLSAAGGSCGTNADCASALFCQGTCTTSGGRRLFGVGGQVTTCTCPCTCQPTQRRRSLSKSGKGGKSAWRPKSGHEATDPQTQSLIESVARLINPRGSG